MLPEKIKKFNIKWSNETGGIHQEHHHWAQEMLLF